MYVFFFFWRQCMYNLIFNLIIKATLHGLETRVGMATAKLARVSVRAKVVYLNDGRIS